ncbi:MAG: prepilin-type N-terminal cleavage/methylation domain-containing protein [Longimicrobiales bacterium]|nr:prepilin-type N-terminal cleavage/methylation domain-containing protein [Longimicrobiales bacterium]
MRTRDGFTLIELLIVVVILGILAAIAIPKFSSTREKAFISTMKSDLRKLAAKQEIHYSETYTYTTSQAALEFVESEAVTLTVVSANSTGWSAEATHPGSSVRCAMIYGDAAPVAPATQPNFVTCG